jgi:hypothetical protein
MHQLKEQLFGKNNCSIFLPKIAIIIGKKDSKSNAGFKVMVVA